jgi:hypothetical protein
MLARVLVCQNDGTSLVQPRVAIGVLGVPVRVDQVFDGIGVDRSQSIRDCVTRDSKAGIDKKLAVRAQSGRRCCRQNPQEY